MRVSRLNTLSPDSLYYSLKCAILLSQTSHSSRDDGATLSAPFLLSVDSSLVAFKIVWYYLCMNKGLDYKSIIVGNISKMIQGLNHLFSRLGDFAWNIYG